MGLEALRTIQPQRRLTLISSNETPFVEPFKDFKKPDLRIIQPEERRLTLVPQAIEPPKSRILRTIGSLNQLIHNFKISPNPLVEPKIIPPPIIPQRGKKRFSASAEIMVFIPFELINKAYSRVRSRITEVKFKVKFWCTPCQRGHVDRMDWSLHSKRLSLGNTRTPDNIIQLDSKKKEKGPAELKKAA